jgi:hypothetical protein
LDPKFRSGQSGLIDKRVQGARTLEKEKKDRSDFLRWLHSMRALRLALAIAAAGLYLPNCVFVLAEDSIDPGLDGTLNHVQYAAAGQPPAAAQQQQQQQEEEGQQKGQKREQPPSPSPSSSATSFSAERAARKAQLLASMALPADGSRIDFDEEHPRFRVLRAMYGFARHQQRYQTDLAGWEDGYKAIPERHRDVRFLSAPLVNR